MTFEQFIKLACKDSEFKIAWEDIHSVNSIAEALDILSKMNEENEHKEPDTSAEDILKNKGIKANITYPNSIIFYEYNNKCPVYDFIISIEDKKLQAKIASDIEWLSIEGFKLKEPKAAYVADGIYELRTKQSNNITRIFYFFIYGNQIILTNGYIKKTQKMDKNEFNKAKKYRDEYSRR